jgi:hypothetical protein
LLRNQQELWQTIPRRFKNEIDLALVESDETHLNRMAEDIFADIADAPIDKIENFLKWISRHPIDKSMLDCYLSQLIENGSGEVRSQTVLYLLNYIFKYKNDIQFIIKHLKSAVSKEVTFSEGMIHNLELILDSLHEELDSIKDNSLDEFKEQIREKISDIPVIDYRAETIIDFAYDSVDSIISFVNYRLQKRINIIRNDKNGSSIKGYDAIPYNGINCVAGKIRNFADYEKFMDGVFDWYEKYKILREFDLIYLVKPLAQLINVSTSRLYLEEYIENQIQCDNIKKAIIASNFLNLSDNTISIIVKVAEKGIESGLTDEVRGMLKPFPSGLYSSSILVGRKELFEKIIQIANNPILKSLVRERINMIKKDIEQDLRREEEFLNPKV